MKIYRTFSWLVVPLILLLSIITGCKKTRIDEHLNPATPFTTDRTELTRDSIYLYALQIYYWNSSLLDYGVFNPRKFPSNDDEVFALTKYSKNPVTGQNYEYVSATAGYPKYSFIDDGSVASQIGGSAGDFGFSVGYASSTDLRIRYVYPGSPADQKGIKRGYQITKLNGRTDLASTSEANLAFISSAISKSNTDVSITLKKPDGSSADVVLTKASYALNPILYSNVYTVGSKKVGYFVFNSFTSNSTNALTQLFTNFTTQGVTELVIDLRYNGGGSVETAEALTNLIAPSSANGATMYDVYYNQTMQNRGAVILKNQKFMDKGVLHSYYEYDYSVSGNKVKFLKTGSLPVSRVYFIVSGSTASASELLINNLKPVLDVKLVGRKTYGKPVGFFAVRIDQSDLYIPQFELRNKSNEGAYYQGLPVDKDDSDDLTHDFGDTSEKLLAYTLTYATKGSFSVSNPKADKLNAAGNPLSEAEEKSISAKLEEGEFKGMVGPRLKFKNK